MTAKLLVIADDLTGANATAAALARDGLHVVTVMDADASDNLDAFARFDAVILSNDSRHFPPEAARAAMTKALHLGFPAPLISNRIDSTLRGNVGVSTEALLHGVRTLSGKPYRALALVAHPDAGRVTLGGLQLLHGHRLEDTELAHDPLNPMHTSVVADIFRHDTRLRVAHIALETVTAGREALVQALENAVADDADVVICDALTVEHIHLVAEAAVHHTAHPWVGVDPGVGTAAMAKAMGISGQHDMPPLLAVSGSATQTTRRQLARLCETGEVAVVKVPIADPLPDSAPVIAALRHALSGDAPIVLLASVLEESDLVAVSPALGKAIPPYIAAIAEAAIAKRRISALYATGGDIATALFSALKAEGMDVSGEIVPLAVRGTLVGGSAAGLPVITKGGLIGDDDCAVQCIRKLQEIARNRRQHATTL